MEQVFFWTKMKEEQICVRNFCFGNRFSSVLRP